VVTVRFATELCQRRPKPSTFRTLTPRHGGSEDQPLYGVARWLGRPWVDVRLLGEDGNLLTLSL